LAPASPEKLRGRAAAPPPSLRGLQAGTKAEFGEHREFRIWEV